MKLQGVPTEWRKYAMPDFPRYRRLALEVKWLQPIARFEIYWVHQDGIVETQ